MHEPNAFLPHRVFEHLKVDDSILRMGDKEYLDMGMTQAIAGRDPDTMTPWRLFQTVAYFNRKLERAGAAVSAERWLPDPGHPNGCYRFRANDDFIVACQGEAPIWFWENKDGRWELNRLRVARESDLPDTFDLAALLDDDEDLDHRDGYRPENLTPMALLGVVMYFAKSLKHVAARVENEPCFPDVRDPNGGYRFREDEGLIVVYRGDEPVWYWKIKAAGLWKLYRLAASEKSDYSDFSDDVALHDGEWD